ncbi:hypothetical protein HG536_0C05470 [Torulaspora globosa]|uniref:Uncharacterized protein n=1 Tax=Torulaspora globosa TaxID=48254 RepID=A0A7G3ZFU2_9SACH|nr:uncharacterized protein HG536_0C05470 [Torulaspora globosa]QLL32378.1 hypothetical protein HG536_0C05470 [Torulaspora globosa]
MMAIGRNSFVRRYGGGVVRDAAFEQYLRDPVKMIVIPVTTERVFIYHKHTKDFLNEHSSLIRLEIWLTRKAGNIWSKLTASPKSYNKKIVAGVNRLLMNIPWTENSLKTIPGDNYLLKRVSKKEGPDGEEGETKLTLKEYLSSKVPLRTKPLNVYYPGKIIAESAVTAELRTLCEQGLQYHRKQALLCLLGLPLTIPIILIPIIPNVPGFYLTYRAYCNLKAYLGAKHLKRIMDTHTPELRFKDLEAYDKIWTGASNCTTQKERLLLNEQNLPELLELLEIPEMKFDLHKAVQQETARLSANR